MLLINNAEQEQLITMRECIEVQEDAFIKLAQGSAAHRPGSTVRALPGPGKLVPLGLDGGRVRRNSTHAG